MIVIIHQAIRVAQPVKTRYHFTKTGKKQLSIFIIEKYRTPCVAARSNRYIAPENSSRRGRAMLEDYAIKNVMSRLSVLDLVS